MSLQITGLSELIDCIAVLKNKMPTSSGRPKPDVRIRASVATPKSLTHPVKVNYDLVLLFY